MITKSLEVAVILNEMIYFLLNLLISCHMSSFETIKTLTAEIFLNMLTPTSACPDYEQLRQRIHRLGELGGNHLHSSSKGQSAAAGYYWASNCMHLPTIWLLLAVTSSYWRLQFLSEKKCAWGNDHSGNKALTIVNASQNHDF